MKQKNGMVTQRLTEDEIMVVPTAGEALNKVLTLNGSGGYIWELLERDRTFDELKEMLMNEYAVSEREAREDLTEFLNIIEDYIE